MNNPSMYRRITQEEAKRVIDSTKCVILDVRTEEEYKQAHIKNSKLLPDFEIKHRATSELPDKDAPILIYCRSGRRSAAAAMMLLNMGYTNVCDFGGIIEWEYGTVR